MLAEPNQGDRLFRTGAHAQPAGMAGVRVRCKRLLPAVREPLELASQTQTATQPGRNGCHGENFVRTDRHALLLAFAAIPVDNGPDKTGGLFAIRFLDFHYSSSLKWSSEDPFR